MSNAKSIPAIITEDAATGEEIAAIVTEVEPVLAPFPPNHCVIALLCMACTLMNPYASADELQDAVHSISQFMCLTLDGKGHMQVMGSPTNEVMN